MREPTEMELRVANGIMDLWEKCGDPDGPPFLDMARSSIRAMRVPTPEVAASFQRWRDPEVAESSWMEAIDAASPEDK